MILMGTQTFAKASLHLQKIIYQIYDENKLFELLDDSGNWWKIKLDSSETKTSTGFIYKSKVIRGFKF